MGIEFKTAEERNPVADPCAEKVAELEQFIDENNLLQKFYVWQGLKEEFKKKLEIQETNSGFEEIN